MKKKHSGDAAPAAMVLSMPVGVYGGAGWVENSAGLVVPYISTSSSRINRYNN